ncbi:MAG TPA: anaerobic C4-dicarboxylate transporter [Plasticicumulans sp.]|uniref:anaerobic C4-dicarboxylate transporter n=1 Tax=Plasticicumulans sp. TaxID=2307179 RepID=UPI000FBB449B|nr:anaerobic C4-dicarboxylate transporter [Plasticicumulans sp.]MBS0602171.1 anaerobic C4-dicarboxylate transporter [Pseudomonadota bacterium]RTL03109.1 MAG: anaerobic C4-dicarboxylate transporter [Xanthomonadales bacterium]HMV38862.1 anaerobic C4-dicarboxylate transporter [Plasticicumulans sp.]HMW28877.1 anaerobic C4-dicarboxylate transporter [Plasticicumulans sp.]HMW42022.1 anaerobic C4-dicarboxylate transporter [Plasticicumulans sp.]
MWTFWLEFILVLGAILLGIRRGGVALGLIGGLGVAVLVFVFRTPPSEPPVTVMLIILAVVTASATLQVAGGLDWLVQQTERLLRAYPQRVTLLAPLATFLLTVCVGTGHAVYALLPVIGDVALRTGIRPERPMAISSVASQMGITASPVAAAVTTFLAFAAKTPTPVGLFDIVMITLPAGLAGVLVAALWSMKRGKDLADDPEYQARLADPQFRAALDVSVTTLGTELPKTAKLSVALFFGGVLTIVMLALFPVLVPVFGGKAVPMTTIVQIVMLGFGALILFATGVKAPDIARSSVFTAGMIAVVSIFGIAWMSDTFVSGNKAFLIEQIEAMVKFAPWTFALAMFAVSAFVKSQAATLTIMIPFGLALSLPVPLLLGLMPSSYAYFFFAFYPSDLAAINMDRTGTTHIGKYLLNHSFMIPGLIGVGVSTTVAYLLSRVLFSY